MNLSSRQEKKALIIFMRYPQPGQVKTRLASDTGVEKAAHVYERMARATLGVACDFAAGHEEVTLFLFFAPREKSREMEECFVGPWKFFPQQGEHLGARMGNALRQVLAMGFHQAVLVGTDLAHPTTGDFSRAFGAFQRGRVPLGMATDGGFYLIGLNRYCRAPFEPDIWGTGSIFERTRRLLEAGGFDVEVLPVKTDVDRLSDLKSLSENPLHEKNLSVIIPTTGTPSEVQPRFEAMEKQLWPGDEIVFVFPEDAFSLPIRPAATRSLCVTAPRGRGIQLNRGVQASRNELLLFLHDDCVPPSQFPYLVRKTLQENRVALGCFSLRFSPSTPSLDLIARWANFRSIFFKVPYGDQGLFCRREIYDRVMGFRKPFILEDVDFVKHCLRTGSLKVLAASQTTSSLRYLNRGILRASLQNHMIILLHHLGVDNRKLYSMYYRDGVLKE